MGLVEMDLMALINTTCFRSDRTKARWFEKQNTSTWNRLEGS